MTTETTNLKPHDRRAHFAGDELSRVAETLAARPVDEDRLGGGIKRLPPDEQHQVVRPANMEALDTSTEGRATPVYDEGLLGRVARGVKSRQASRNRGLGRVATTHGKSS